MESLPVDRGKTKSKARILIHLILEHICLKYRGVFMMHVSTMCQVRNLQVNKGIGIGKYCCTASCRGMLSEFFGLAV